MCRGVLWCDKKKGSFGRMISVLWCTVEVGVKGALFYKAVGSRVVAVSTGCVRKSLCVRIFSSSEKNVHCGAFRKCDEPQCRIGSVCAVPRILCHVCPPVL